MAKILIVGLAKSGIAAAGLLAEHGETVFISEAKELTSAALSLIEQGIVKENNIETGVHTDRFVKEADLIVLSPGVRNDSRPVRLGEQYNVPIISELELAYLFCPAPIVAVTGTSGKTTVTTLIGQMLRKSGSDAVVCGNIGNPFSGEVGDISKDSIVVLEVSSFQLERINKFRPKISVILNISENHLDRHKDMDEYISMKCKIFSNQGDSDIVFLNGRDAILKKIAKNIAHTKVEFFDEYKDFSKSHNIHNEDYLAAMSVVSFLGVEEDVMVDVISDFKGIEHRLEYVTTLKDIVFINDSKATTVSSVEWALKSLDGRIILIAGGRYKGGDFGRLRQLVADKVEYVIVIGEAGALIKKQMAGFKEVIEEDSLDNAVRTAFKKAKKGTKVLLSPGCSSFDMFSNYEERGKAFKELCLGLVPEK